MMSVKMGASREIHLRNQMLFELLHTLEEIVKHIQRCLFRVAAALQTAVIVAARAKPRAGLPAVQTLEIPETNQIN